MFCFCHQITTSFLGVNPSYDNLLIRFKNNYLNFLQICFDVYFPIQRLNYPKTSLEFKSEKSSFLFSQLAWLRLELDWLRIYVWASAHAETVEPSSRPVERTKLVPCSCQIGRTQQFQLLLVPNWLNFSLNWLKHETLTL